MPTTTTYDRGAVVLLPFPFSDLSSAKVRPAFIVSPHYPSDDLLVVAVTSVGDALRPGEFPIQFWREAGLIHPSFAKRAVASVSGAIGASFRRISSRRHGKGVSELFRFPQEVFPRAIQRTSDSEHCEQWHVYFSRLKFLNGSQFQIYPFRESCLGQTCRVTKPPQIVPE